MRNWRNTFKRYPYFLNHSCVSDKIKSFMCMHLLFIIHLIVFCPPWVCYFDRACYGGRIWDPNTMWLTLKQHSLYVGNVVCFVPLLDLYVLLFPQVTHLSKECLSHHLFIQDLPKKLSFLFSKISFGNGSVSCCTCLFLDPNCCLTFYMSNCYICSWLRLVLGFLQVLSSF